MQISKQAASAMIIAVVSAVVSVVFATIHLLLAKWHLLPATQGGAWLVLAGVGALVLFVVISLFDKFISVD